MYILLDLEAVGTFDKKDDFMEIVEIAAHKMIEWNGIYHIISTFHSFVRPIYHKKISRKQSRLLKLDEKALKEARYYDEVMKEFVEWVGDDAIIIAWGDNDERMIKVNNEKHSLYEIKDFFFRDLQKEYDKVNHKTKRTGLKNALNELEYGFYGQEHSASYDALNLLPVFQTLQCRA